MSGFVVRELSAIFVSCSAGGDAADKHVVEGLVLRFEEALERYRKRRVTAMTPGIRWAYRGGISIR